METAQPQVVLLIQLVCLDIVDDVALGVQVLFPLAELILDGRRSFSWLFCPQPCHHLLDVFFDWTVRIGIGNIRLIHF